MCVNAQSPHASFHHLVFQLRLYFTPLKWWNLTVCTEECVIWQFKVCWACNSSTLPYSFTSFIQPLFLLKGSLRGDPHLQWHLFIRYWCIAENYDWLYFAPCWPWQYSDCIRHRSCSDTRNTNAVSSKQLWWRQKPVTGMFHSLLFNFC